MQVRIANLALTLLFASSLSTSSATPTTPIPVQDLSSSHGLYQISDIITNQPILALEHSNLLQHHKFSHGHPSQRVRRHTPLRRLDDPSSQLPSSSSASTPTISLPEQSSSIMTSSLELSSLSLSSARSPTLSSPASTVSLPDGPKLSEPTDSPPKVTIIDDGTHKVSSVAEDAKSASAETPSVSTPSPSSPSTPRLQLPSISLPAISINLPTLIPPHTPQGPPSPPQGASLVQFRPSLRTKASVPMFVNDGWHSKSETPISDKVVASLLGGKEIKSQNVKEPSAGKKGGKKGQHKLSKAESKGSKKASAVGHKSSRSSKKLSKNQSRDLDVSPATSAYISIHGRDRNAPQAFENVYKALKNGGVSLDGQDADAILVAPNFFIHSDGNAAPGTSFFNPKKNLWWPAEGHQDGPYGLFDGADATGPPKQLLLAQISTFDVLDQLVAQFSNPAVYPNMKNITITAHSAGAELVQRWSAIGSYSLPSADEGLGESRIHLRMIIANSPSSVYFTKDRPDNPSGATRVPSRAHKSGTISKTGCLYNHWRYGFDGKQPRYVELKLAQVGGIATAIEEKGRLLFSQWIRKDVVRLVGTLDTSGRASGGDRSCAVKTQGGKNRRDRNYAFWAYQTLLAGNDEDVTEFYGYKNLSRSVTPIPNLSGATQHRLGIVNGVGHVASRMYASPVGMSALLDKEVKAGPRPPPMPSSHKDGDGDKNVAGGRHKNGGSYGPKTPISLKDLDGNSASTSPISIRTFYLFTLGSALSLLLVL